MALTLHFSEKKFKKAFKSFIGHHPSEKAVCWFIFLNIHCNQFKAGIPDWELKVTMLIN